MTLNHIAYCVLHIVIDFMPSNHDFMYFNLIKIKIKVQDFCQFTVSPAGLEVPPTRAQVG